MATGTITSLGIGSSLDLQGILDSLREADETAITLKEVTKTELEATKNEFNSINAKFLSMKSSALSLSLSSNFLNRASSVSATGVLSASVASGTDIGSYSVTVDRLTTSSSFQSIGKSSATNSINVPTMLKSVETFAAGETFLAEDETMTITHGYGENRRIISITGESGGNTIQEVAELINQASENGGDSSYVTASALAVSDSEFVLRIKATGDGTGESNRVTVTVPPDSTTFSADLDRNISQSSSSFLSATLIHAPAIGEYEIDIDRLATKSSFQSDEKVDENALVSSGNDTFEYTVGDSAVFSVAVTAATTLADLRDAINTESPDEVTASIISSGSGVALVIEADTTGETGRIQVISPLDQVTMTESNGAGYTMTGDSAVAASTVITEGVNDTIVFQENDGSGYGSEITATIAAGTYTQEELAAALQNALVAASVADGDSKSYNAAYNSNIGRIEIQENGTLTGFKVLWSDAGTTAAADLGFDAVDEEITPKNSSLNFYAEVDGVAVQGTGNSGQTTLISGVSMDLSATGTTTVDITAGEGETFSYRMGDSDEVSIRVTSDTTLENLVDLINDDENNPGVTASIINTGSGETPFRLMLKADDAGEDSRIRITSNLADLAMSEANGAGYTMASDNELSFSAITFDATNNTIDFTEDTGSGPSAELTATIAQATYTSMDTLAAAIETAMETASANSVDYSVTYNSTSGKFDIEDNGSTLTELQLLWNSGTNSATSAASQLGFDSSADDTGAINYASDNSVLQFSSAPIVIRASDGNTDIVFQEDDGEGFGAQITASIADGVYASGSALADAVETALEEASAASGASKDYVVSFDETSQKLEIQEAGTLTGFRVLWSDAGSTAASALGFDAVDETITPAESSLNASVTVDGVQYQRTQNSGLTDIISGATISLTGTGTTALNITEDTAAIKEHITSIVTTFNDIISEIDANDDYDEENETWGTLAKSPSLRSAKDMLLSLFGTTVSANETITSYFDFGFEINKDGSISLDEEVLDSMITSSYEDIKTFFLGTTEGKGVTGMGDLLNDKIKEFTQSGGLIDSETDALDDRIARIEDQIEKENERLEKRYETMAQQFVQLDSYMRQMESQQNYVSQIWSATEQNE